MPFYLLFIQTSSYLSSSWISTFSTSAVPLFSTLRWLWQGQEIYAEHPGSTDYSAVRYKVKARTQPQQSLSGTGSSQHSTSSTPASFAFSSLTVASPLYFFSVRSLLAASNSDSLFWSWRIFRWWRASSSFFCCSCCCWYWTWAYYRIICQRRKNRNRNREKSEGK